MKRCRYTSNISTEATCLKWTSKNFPAVWKKVLVCCTSMYHHKISPDNNYMITFFSYLPSVLWHCWLGGRKGIWPVKNGGMVDPDWLVQTEWHPAGRSVCLPLSIFPCTIKSRSSLLASAHPGGPGKRAVKQLWCISIWQDPKQEPNSSWDGRPFGHNRHAPKIGRGCAPFGGTGSPSNTKSPRPRPTSISSGILIHAAVWPQWTWAENWGLSPF